MKPADIVFSGVSHAAIVRTDEHDSVVTSSAGDGKINRGSPGTTI
jgi:hypothetical protein